MVVQWGISPTPSLGYSTTSHLEHLISSAISNLTQCQHLWIAFVIRWTWNQSYWACVHSQVMEPPTRCGHHGDHDKVLACLASCQWWDSNCPVSHLIVCSDWTASICIVDIGLGLCERRLCRGTVQQLALRTIILWHLELTFSRVTPDRDCYPVAINYASAANHSPKVSDFETYKIPATKHKNPCSGSSGALKADPGDVVPKDLICHLVFYVAVACRPQELYTTAQTHQHSSEG